MRLSRALLCIFSVALGCVAFWLLAAALWRMPRLSEKCFDLSLKTGDSCITFPVRSDGFGAQLQFWYAGLVQAARHCMAPCIALPSGMEHVNSSVRTVLLEMSGIHFEDSCQPFKCRELGNEGPELHMMARVSQTNSWFRSRLRAMYRAPRQLPAFFWKGRLNVAIHFRVRNAVDTRDQDRYDQDLLNVMENVRKKYAKHRPLFHVFSQTVVNPAWNILFPLPDDVRLWLDTGVVDTFDAMVRADILVIAPSAFSYSAALLSRGLVLQSAKYPYHLEAPRDWKYF